MSGEIRVAPYTSCRYQLGGSLRLRPLFEVLAQRLPGLAFRLLGDYEIRCFMRRDTMPNSELCRMIPLQQQSERVFFKVIRHSPTPPDN
jgi:hypothetical protein